MLVVLDALVLGFTPPPRCNWCRESLADACPDCTQALAAVAAVNAATAAVESAESEDKALAAGLRGVLAVSGIDEATSIRLLRLAGTGTGAEQGGAA